MHEAAKAGNTAAIARLLSNGTDINCVDWVRLCELRERILLFA